MKIYLLFYRVGKNNIILRFFVVKCLSYQMFEATKNNFLSLLCIIHESPVHFLFYNLIGGRWLLQ